MYVYQESSPSRRLTGIAIVALLHLAIIYALVTGLGRQAIEVLRGPVETKLIEEVKPPPPDVPLVPPPLTAPPPPYVPPPDIQVRQPVSERAITAVVRQPAPAPVVAPPAPEPVRTKPSVEVGKSCRIPDYPSASKMLSESGTVVLRFLVDVDGRVLESQVESSSGYPRLDEAARAALSLCHFRAGTADGKPERSWAKLRYVWKLN
jgi:protein TonB